jgi:hypothetical protein
MSGIVYATTGGGKLLDAVFENNIVGSYWHSIERTARGSGPSHADALHCRGTKTWLSSIPRGPVSWPTLMGGVPSGTTA